MSVGEMTGPVDVVASLRFVADTVIRGAPVVDKLGNSLHTSTSTRLAEILTRKLIWLMSKQLSTHKSTASLLFVAAYRLHGVVVGLPVPSFRYLLSSHHSCQNCSILTFLAAK